MIRALCEETTSLAHLLITNTKIFSEDCEKAKVFCNFVKISAIFDDPQNNLLLVDFPFLETFYKYFKHLYWLYFPNRKKSWLTEWTNLPRLHRSREQLSNWTRILALAWIRVQKWRFHESCFAVKAMKRTKKLSKAYLLKSDLQNREQQWPALILSFM